MRALVVDDSSAARSILKELFQSFTLKVDTAASGEEALAALQTTENPYKLVVTDWQMPGGIDGIELIERIRATALPHQPRILLISGHRQIDLQQQAEQLGAEECLSKPVNRSTAYDTLVKIFGTEIYSQASNVPGSRQSAIDDLQSLLGYRLLLVEDNKINQQIAQELLEGMNASLDIANNGLEALAAIERNHYDAVLMDIQMPEMDGMEATRRIRALGRSNRPDCQRFTDLVIIAMTAHAMSGDRDLSLQAGMNDHLTKPIDPDLLFRTLHSWLKPHNRQIEVVEVDTATQDVLLASVSSPLLPPATDEQLVLTGVDTKAGLRCIGGNLKAYRRILQQFHEKNQNTLAQIDAAISASDYTTARNQVHTIKGNAGNIGAKDLFTAAAALEESLQQNPPTEALPQLRQTFSNCFAVVMDSLAQLEPSSEPAKDAFAQRCDRNAQPQGIEPQVLKHRLQELEHLLQVDVAVALDRLQDLNEATQGTSANAGIQQLQNAVLDFDLDAARVQLQDLSEQLET